MKMKQDKVIRLLSSKGLKKQWLADQVGVKRTLLSTILNTDVDEILNECIKILEAK